MAPLLDAHYLDPDVAKAMVRALHDPARRAAYAAIPTRRAFARAVSDDLRAISHDLHVTLRFEDAQAKAGPSRAEREHDAMLEANAGFVSVERWPGNVAYMRIDSFGPYAEGVKGDAVYAEKMKEIADAAALVLDLRGNFGGYPEMVALLVSYLVDPAPVHLVDLWDHDDGSTFASWTRATVAGPRFGSKKPVFVLIGGETFSGGEEAAYDLQALKRAVLIGSRTRGGANFAPRHAIDEHFTFSVPQGRAVSAITGSSWEGVGVQPDVAVDAEAAPKEAMARLAGKAGK
jgi:C-terminal processing protease CtpA/Prc